jgi:hypothetical protein
MKIKATVTETLVVQKEVELEVSTEQDIEEAIREKAYEDTIMDGDHGWEGINCLEVDIDYEEVA